tara:strand:+ start:1051 stop:1815 length:765 start_codon:yes stop_codon:yes gene_type:complete
MQHILGISGSKQSGKTTCANFLHGYQMKFHDIIDKFFMNDRGEILVNTTSLDEKGEEVEGVGIIDVFRTDYEFSMYASQNIWPFVKAFSFADPLKALCIGLFGLNYEQCHGSDDDKNTPVNIKWEHIPGVKNKEGYLTAREFMQVFGTDICRTIKPDIWTAACIDRIHKSGTELAIVADCRFPNEVEALQKAGGKVIRLTRNPFEDEHASEIALNEYDGFDCVIDNSSMSIDESNKLLLNTLKEWGWLKAKVTK